MQRIRSTLPGGITERRGCTARLCRAAKRFAPSRRESIPQNPEVCGWPPDSRLQYRYELGLSSSQTDRKSKGGNRSLTDSEIAKSLSGMETCPWFSHSRNGSYGMFVFKDRADVAQNYCPSAFTPRGRPSC
jgi:hypothetical protein